MNNMIKKPTLSLLSAARGSNINYEVFWTSEPYKIGKTFWVHVLYYCDINNRFYEGFHFHDADYERCIPCSEWKKEKDHPKYNFNDGTYAGLPKGLIRLWEKNNALTKKVCTAKTKQEGIELINNHIENKEQNLFSL